MGRQVNFYMNPEDLLALQAEMARRGNVAIFASRSANSSPAQLSNVTVGVYGQEDLMIYLARSQDVAVIHARPAESPGSGFFIDSNVSPVLEFSRCYCADNFIRRGRFWVSTGRLDGNGKRMRPDREFLRWADGWIGWIRRHFTRLDGGDYVGP